jgi:AcrR family transcriptional regulator
MGRGATRTVLDRETRRQQILSAAAAVFARKGYRHASVSDIIEAAGIARGTFYLYFQSKEEIFLALIDVWFEELSRRLQDSLEEECWSSEAFQEWRCRDLRDWFEFFHARRELAQVVFREAEAIDPRFEARMGELLERIDEKRTRRIRQLQEAGFWRSDLDVGFLNTCLNALFREMVLRYILPYEKPDIDWLVSQINTFIQFGVASRPEVTAPAEK